MTHHHQHDDAPPPKEFWEGLYRDRDQVWTGKVNAVLAEVAATLRPGTALDLGCGEGGDVVWLAQQGWRAIGVDISEVAITRARAAAKRLGLGERQAEFLVEDLSQLDVRGPFDLVTASFFQSPVQLDRVAILRRAAGLVARGGHLLVTAHAAPPPWANPQHVAAFTPFAPADEIEALGLVEGDWEQAVAEVRTRVATGPDGQQGELADSVVLMRRRP